MEVHKLIELSFEIVFIVLIVKFTIYVLNKL